MCSKKLTINDTLDYILNDDSDFDDLGSDSDIAEIGAIGNNSDGVGANVIIEDAKLHNWMKMRTLIFQKMNMKYNHNEGKTTTEIQIA